MTTNGKGSMGEPSLGMQHDKERLNIRANHQNCILSNGPDSDREEETLTRHV